MIRLAANALRQSAPPPVAAAAAPPTPPARKKAPARTQICADAEIAGRLDRLYALIKSTADAGDGRMPASREMMAAVGVQTQSGAQNYVRRLVRAGRLAREHRAGSMKRYYIYRITETGQRLRARIMTERGP